MYELEEMGIVARTTAAMQKQEEFLWDQQVEALFQQGIPLSIAQIRMVESPNARKPGHCH